MRYVVWTGPHIKSNSNSLTQLDLYNFNSVHTRPSKYIKIFQIQNNSYYSLCFFNSLLAYTQMSGVNHIPLKRVMSENSGLCYYLEFLVISARWFVVWLIASQFSSSRPRLCSSSHYGPRQNMGLPLFVPHFYHLEPIEVRSSMKQNIHSSIFFPAMCCLLIHSYIVGKIVHYNAVQHVKIIFKICFTEN